MAHPARAARTVDRGCDRVDAGPVLHRFEAEPERITRPPLGGGYAHELIEVTECLQAGRTESAVMPLADTLVVQDVMGQALDQLGVGHVEAPAQF